MKDARPASGTTRGKEEATQTARERQMAEMLVEGPGPDTDHNLFYRSPSPVPAFLLLLLLLLYSRYKS